MACRDGKNEARNERKKMTTINISQDGKPLACGRISPKNLLPEVWTPTTGWRVVREEFFKTFVSLAQKAKNAKVSWTNCPWCGTSEGSSSSHGICLACHADVLRAAGIDPTTKTTFNPDWKPTAVEPVAARN